MKRKIFSKLLMGALLFASVSTFVSCKDYDDDINNLSARIDAVAGTQLSQLKSELATQIAAAQAAADAAKAAAATAQEKANQVDAAASTAEKAVAAAEAAQATAAAAEAKADEAAANQDVEDLKAAITALETAIADAKAGAVTAEEFEAKYKEIEAAIVAINEGLLTADDVKKLLEDADFASAATVKDIQSQIAELQKFNEGLAALLGLNVAELADWQDATDKAIKALQDALKDVPAKADVDAAKAAAKKAQDAVDALTAENGVIASLQKKYETADKEIQSVRADLTKVSSLNVFVQRMLTSVTLVPSNYIGGIEAIEFTSIKYVPQVWDAKAGDIKNKEKASALTIGNSETEADYRLSPTSVKLDEIDVDNIQFYGKTANETRAATATAKSPVEYVVGSAKLANTGILTVKLHKTVTRELYKGYGVDAQNRIDIVSVKVPRKANAEKGIEAADIYSEFVRVAESTITPKIAALNWAKAADHNSASDLTYHYSDSATIWASKVNAKELVKKEVKYDADFDLSTLVTGCYIDDNGTHQQITKAELAKYGIAFRFELPTTAYTTNADNNTNQQKFAKINGNIITSQIENGEAKNKAAAGKEPIVRVILYNTANGDVLDLRYLKIKWVADDTPDKAAVDLGTIEAGDVTLKCDPQTVANITWAQFINDVYGKKIEGVKEDMSQEEFENIYKTWKWEIVGDDKANTIKNNSTVTVAKSTNEKGDATIASWQLTEKAIGKIDQTTGKKDFKLKITFESSQKKSYGDLVLTWNVAVKLPKLPSIHGYYDSYWYTSDYSSHYIEPIQYNTPEQTLAYAVYNSNLFNAYTYNLNKPDANGNLYRSQGVPVIIDNLLDPCGDWDVQFSAGQTIANVYAGYGWNFTKNTAVAKPAEPHIAGGSTLHEQLWNNIGGNKVDIAIAAELIKKGASAGSYYEPDPFDPVDSKVPYLFADHKNKYNYDLINPIKAGNIGERPERTDDKKIDITIWARINEYNVVAVKKYTVALVAPLGIKANLDGYFEDAIVSGSEINCADAFTMIDFAGYEVKDAAPGAGEFRKYRQDLYKYYEVNEPEYDLDNVVYGYKTEGGSIKVDNTVTTNKANDKVIGGMTAKQIEDATNGNIVLSITQPSGDKSKLIFKRNGGSPIEAEVQAFVPVTLTYGFGKVTQYVQIPIVPRGSKPAGK